MSDLAAALQVAIRVHADQRDKQGQPYLLHVLRVVEAVSDEAKVVAALHDVMEDGDPILACAEECLLSGPEIAAIEALTRLPDETYAQYINGILAQSKPLTQRLAREVKLADLRYNLGRIPSTPGDDNLDRLERRSWASLKARYEKAINTLEGTDASSSPTGSEAVTQADRTA